MSERAEDGMLELTGSTLQLLRRLRGLGLSELAEASGMERQQVSRYEKGTVRPQLAQLDRLLRGMEVPLEVFLFAWVVVAGVQGVLGNKSLIRGETFERFREALRPVAEASEGAVGDSGKQDTD